MNKRRIPLETFISPANTVSNGGSQDLSHICWLDELLTGGIHLYENEVREKNGSEPPFVLLLAGPPGSGKTTLALQLCYNLATKGQKSTGDCVRSLYISTESRTHHILENAAAFGWDTSKIVEFEDSLPAYPARCAVYGSEKLVSVEKDWRYSGFLTEFKTLWNTNIGESPFGNLLSAAFDAEEVNDSEAPPESLPPPIVVIDSLNVFQADPAYTFTNTTEPNQSLKSHLPPDPHALIGQQFHGLLREFVEAKKSPDLLIVILDSESNDHHPFWEFLADAIFVCDYQIGAENYFTRSFQILKIKTQEHVLGKQVLKIISQSRAAESKNQSKEGGVYIYPSVHWYLDRAGHFLKPFSRKKFYSSGIDGLDAILGEGFPPMHTTALVGRRGAMKSHAAYTFMLQHAIGRLEKPDEPKNVLLISLRNDEGSAKDTLATILFQQGLSPSEAAADQLVQDLIANDRLDIVCNAPGCVTPEELFNKIFVAIIRPRMNRPFKIGENESGNPSRETAEIVVLDGLEHLEAKFPLCAAEKVFVPALVTLFRNAKVCSIVISAAEDSTTLGSIGPLADLVLEFSNVDTERNYFTGGKEKWGIPALDVCSVPIEAIQYVEVTASRVPAGQIGGLWGVLSRDSRGKMRFQTPKKTDDQKK